MASRDWHKMNDMVAEIERNREKINCVTLHANSTPGSLSVSALISLKSKHDALYDELYDLTTSMLKKVEA